INHLQDCGKDYQMLNRVYLTRDTLEKHDAHVDMLGAQVAAPALRATITELNHKTKKLLETAQPFADLICDTRLAMEVGAIHSLAEKLVARLYVADPLSEKVHEDKIGFAAIAAKGALGALCRRLLRPKRPALGSAQ
ncbi:MAG: squalene/phytoene synthase family protein, partial [Methylocystis sp.]